MGICNSGDQYHAQIERHMGMQDKADKMVKKLLLLYPTPNPITSTPSTPAPELFADYE